jgi:hypothetical protein
VADTPPAGTRTVGELLEAAAARRAEREARAAVRATAAAERRGQLLAQQRELRLEAVAADEENVCARWPR